MAEYAHAQQTTNNAQRPGGEPACVPSTPEVPVCLPIRRSKRLASQAAKARDSTDPDPDDFDGDVDDAGFVPRSPTQGVDGRGIVHHTSSTSTFTPTPASADADIASHSGTSASAVSDSDSAYTDSEELCPESALLYADNPFVGSATRDSRIASELLGAGAGDGDGTDNTGRVVAGTHGRPWVRQKEDGRWEVDLDSGRFATNHTKNNTPIRNQRGAAGGIGRSGRASDGRPE